MRKNKPYCQHTPWYLLVALWTFALGTALSYKPPHMAAAPILIEPVPIVEGNPWTHVTLRWTSSVHCDVHWTTESCDAGRPVYMERKLINADNLIIRGNVFVGSPSHTVTIRNNRLAGAVGVKVEGLINDDKR